MAEFSKHRAEAVRAAKRYEDMTGATSDPDYERINLVMDLTAADGVNGNNPLDWDRLLAADDFNFLHDITGISRHMDRVTGVIGGFFVPRFTRKQAA